LYWQDIPSLVEAREGRTVHKQQLSPRFQELIDMVAMRKRLTGADAYLEQWRKGRVEERQGDVQALVAAVVQDLEARYDDIRAAAIAGLDQA
jgi:hypothetical protein